MLIMQLTFGAIYRHTYISGWLIVHALFAAIVTLKVVFVVTHLYKKQYDSFSLRQPASLMLFMVFLQIFLGFASWVALSQNRSQNFYPRTDLEIVVRVGHVVTGAMILAMAVVIMLRSFWLLTPEASDSSSLAVNTPLPEGEGAGA